MAVNGNAQTLTPAQKRQLAGPAVSTPFDAYQLLFPTFDMGRVFDLSNRDVRSIKDMLKQDGQARKVEQVLTLPIRSAAWEIRAAPGGDREYRYIRAQLDDKLDKVIDQLTTAIAFRKAFFELTFDLDGDQVVLSEIAYRPPATCEAAWDPKTGQPLGFRQRIGNPGGIITVSTRQAVGDTPGYVVVEPDRAFVFVHGSYREPIEGLSDLDVALWCYETTKKIQFLWFSFLEQQSLPKLVAYGDDQTQADRNADALADAKASGVLGVQRSSDPTARAFDIVESSGKGASQFLDAINYLEGKMSASVLAGFTDLAGISAHSRTGSGGSYALSADQSEFFLAARQAVADEIAEAVSRDLIAKLCVLQFGADAKPPTLEIGPLSKRDKDRSMGMLNALLTADHFNAPPGLIDLLIKSTAGYLGLPVDQVAKLVDDHPAKDPAPTGPGQHPASDNAGYVSDQAATGPDAPVGPAETDPTAAKFKELAGLSNAVALTHELVSRVNAGEDPAAVLDDLALARHVRTEAGVKRYGLPIGSPITGGKAPAPVTKTVHAPTAAKPAPSSPDPKLGAMKAQADKLGPHSKAAADYRKALAEQPAPAPAAKKKLTLADLHKAAGKNKTPTAKAPATPAKVPPVTVKPKPLSTAHKNTSLDNLPPQQIASLKRYSGDAYKPINDGLRAGRPSKNVQADIANIDAALAATPLAQPTKVWRTVGGNAFGLSPGSSPDASKALKGKVFTEAGFMSTSSLNERFPVKPPPVHITVEVPAGVGGVYIEPITVNPQENELLLPRNLRYVMTNVRYHAASGGWTATARVLPPVG